MYILVLKPVVRRYRSDLSCVPTLYGTLQILEWKYSRLSSRAGIEESTIGGK